VLAFCSAAAETRISVLPVGPRLLLQDARVVKVGKGVLEVAQNKQTVNAHEIMRTVKQRSLATQCVCNLALL
jgi:hypothetical protein